MLRGSAPETSLIQKGTRSAPGATLLGWWPTVALAFSFSFSFSTWWAPFLSLLDVEASELVVVKVHHFQELKTESS